MIRMCGQLNDPCRRRLYSESFQRDDVVRSDVHLHAVARLLSALSTLTPSTGLRQ